jgi:hypothetical protein
MLYPWLATAYFLSGCIQLFADGKTMILIWKGSFNKMAATLLVLSTINACCSLSYFFIFANPTTGLV